MSIDPRATDNWQHVGRSAREAAEDGGCCGWGKFFLIVIVILLALSGLWYWMGG
jgi:hypothetical protein